MMQSDDDVGKVAAASTFLVGKIEIYTIIYPICAPSGLPAFTQLVALDFHPPAPALSRSLRTGEIPGYIVGRCHRYRTRTECQDADIFAYVRWDIVSRRAALFLS
jgi:hypothetical protein